jgi:2-phospho-L-lactate guanylyltransferase
MPVWAVIPLKSPDSAKSRLAGILSAQQRVRLFYTLASRVIDATLLTPGIEGVHVVTASEAVADFATSLGARCVLLERDCGTAAACTMALKKMPPACRQRVLFVAGDIPLISSGELSRFVGLPERRPLVAIAADRHQVGTNALLCAPGDAIPLCFGGNSFAQHLAAAARLGVAVHIIDSAPLALDIDEAGDLHEWRRRLAESGRPVDFDHGELFATKEAAFSQ